MRPNIRIEIQNDTIEPMDVEENEEGELEDSENEEITKIRLNTNPPSIVNEPSVNKFVTRNIGGVFDKNEQEKLQERAKRFQLKPDEIKNFTDQHLKNLYISLGINSKNESNVRFETIHMRGVDGMTTEDILNYFINYAPLSIEWIDDNCCTVIWSDRLSAARALHFISKAVKGMPVRDDQSYFETPPEPEEIDQSILLINKNREVELQEDPPILNPINELKDSVDISIITSTIPPGYWRLGNNYNTKCILLRFGLKTDQQPFKTEQFSWYYKKQGKKTKSQGIFGRNKDLNRDIDSGSTSTSTNSKSGDNPWSILAKNWDEDAPFRERDPIVRNPIPEPKLEIKNPILRTRLGSKQQKLKEESESDDDNDEDIPKKSKIPRMRMYADEEEEKIKRKKLFQTIKHTFDRITENEEQIDLRKVLSANSRKTIVKKERPVVDLGTTLKNRNKKMVFEVKTERDVEDNKEEEDDSVRRERHNRFNNDNNRLGRKRTHQTRDKIFYDEDNDQDNYRKPKSKVAVVIKTQKKPAVASAVASTVWSRINRPNHNQSSDDDEEDDQEEVDDDEEDESSSGQSKSDDKVPIKHVVHRKEINRPGFRISQEMRHRLNKNPLKIEISNDHFKNI